MEHYLLIGPTDLTATMAPDKEHQWHYAAPGAVRALLAKLAPKPKPKKKAQSEPTKAKVKANPPVRSFAGAYFAACPTDEDLQALFKFVDSYRVTCAPEVLAAVTSSLAQDYFKCKVVRPLPLTEWIRNHAHLHSTVHLPQVNWTGTTRCGAIKSGKQST